LRDRGKASKLGQSGIGPVIGQRQSGESSENDDKTGSEKVRAALVKNGLSLLNLREDKVCKSKKK
jgi:hypothetical protein